MLEQPVGAVPWTRSPQPPDERLKDVSLVTRLMRRPELGAAAGLILVTIFFLSTADPSMFTLAGDHEHPDARRRSSASSPSPRRS